MTSGYLRAGKPRAARWAIKYLAEEWGEVILQALRTDEAKRSVEIPLSRIKEFIDFADAQFRPAKISWAMGKRN